MMTERDFNNTPRIINFWILRLLTRVPEYRELVLQKGLCASQVNGLLGQSAENIRSAGRKSQDKKQALSGAKGEVVLDGLLQRLHLMARKPPKMPIKLERNAAVLQDLMKLNTAETQFITFVALLNVYPSLLQFLELTKTSSLSSSVSALSSMLNLPRSTVTEFLLPHNRLVQSGLFNSRVFFNNFIDLNELEFTVCDLPRKLVFTNVTKEALLKSYLLPAKQPTLALEDFPHLKTDLDILLPYLSSATRSAKKGVNILLHGDPGTGKTELAKIIAQTLQQRLYELDFDPLDTSDRNKEHRLQTFRAAQFLLSPNNAMILFDEADDVFGTEVHYIKRQLAKPAYSGKSTMNQLLESNPIPTLWIINDISELDPAYARRFDTVIAMKTLPLTQRRRIVERYFGNQVPAEALERLSSHESITPAVVERAAKVLRKSSKVTLQQRGEMMEHLVNRTLEAQGLPGIKVNSFRSSTSYKPELINVNLNPATLVDGLRHAPFARLCFYGLPGTGKTAFAHWIAKQLEKPLLVKRASDLLSAFVGENEKNIAQAFEQALRDDSILLIDEVDGFLQDRRNAHQNWEVTAVNEMLTQMEAFEGIFIASTNRLDRLDQAALRRFDAKIHFQPLAHPQALQLLTDCCEKLSLNRPAEADSKALSRIQQLTPGDFAALMRRQSFIAVASCADFVAELASECALKEQAKTPIGFVV